MSRPWFASLFASALFVSSASAFAEPITLDAALAQGEQASPRVVRAEADLRAAEARAVRAGLRPAPELALEVENFAGTGPYDFLRQTETTLSVSQEFEFGGERRARRKVAAAELSFARLGVRQAEAELGYDIAVAHAELRAAEDRAVLARGNVTRAEELSRIAGLLVDAGRDPPLRKLRADALLAESRAESVRAFGLLLTARRRLGLLIASEDPELSAAAGELPRATPLPAEVASLNERLAAAERDAASARIALARAEGIPNVTASGGIRRFEETNDQALLVGVSIPLPFRRDIRAGVPVALAESEAAEAALAQARIETRFTRQEAETLLSAANERLAALSGAGLLEATEALRVAEIGYRAGKFSLLELIEAQEALNRANLALIEAQLDRARALAALARANVQ
jgi:cobalt-zinc-cadmium efflux system outer membrane protein